MWQTVRKRWEAAGIVPRPEAAEAAFDAFERRHCVRLPNDVRAFYAETDGMPAGAWDEVLLNFWPLAEVGPVPALLSSYRGIPDYGGIELSLPDAGSYFVFADHSIWLHVYAVRVSPESSAACPVVWIGGGDVWEVLAPSFREFLQLYAEEPLQVLFPAQRHAVPPDPAA